MNTSQQVELETTNADAVQQVVLAEVLRFNQSNAGPPNESRLVLSARDVEGKLIGGLVGASFWNALLVDLLWVGEQNRVQGIGRALMNRAEAEAVRRNCEIVYLSTFAFQAPGFYERLGYRAFGLLQGVPQNSNRTWYAKRLESP